jgi:hypothetical protein
MSCDKLVFDLAQEIEGTPNIFIKKDWLNILDNQNGSYSANQSVLDTSVLSNSNKYMNYREAYLSVPLLLSLASTTATEKFKPEDTNFVDYGIGLKNWFGSIVHSLTLDYNGVTVIQQTPFCNMWNAFKLMTSLSWSDITTEGATLGFYPDDPLSWTYQGAASKSGQGVCNNTNLLTVPGSTISTGLNKYNAGQGNIGFLKRQTFINFDPAGIPGSGTYSALLPADNAKALWKSYINKKVNGTTTLNGYIQISVRATIYLKHLHSFFNMVPLLKGAYMKITLNLNNATVELSASADANAANQNKLTITSVSVPVGGICPLMIASADTNNGLDLEGLTSGPISYRANLSVGNVCLDSTLNTYIANNTGTLTPNIYLYVPAYSFSPEFERVYISDPIKTIQYTDIYQYQVIGVGNGSTFNSLLTNGIANIKSVLILPYYSAGTNAGLPPGVSPFQSPFDPAGSCATSPLCLFTNFNVVVSGQNAIYNTERYSFEHFNNQFLGTNAVNGALTDGITSGLVDQLGFDMEYCYYYTNVSRMLPVEERVPKSVQIVGQNMSGKNVDLYCFIEYGTSVSINIVTGARV